MKFESKVDLSEFLANFDISFRCRQTGYRIHWRWEMELCLQFLSLCNGNNTGADEQAEQRKKNIAIEKQISKSKQALRKEQKILLLGKFTASFI